MKKVYVVIVVLLVALVSTSYVIGASQEGNGNENSDQIAAQSNNEMPPGNNDTGQAEEKVRYMFVQSVQSGSFVQTEGELNYTLALEGVAPQTIAFSDRPERVVGQVPMQQFLDGLGFSPKHPANAAIEILEGNESEDVIVVELFDPVYDAANHTLQYNVSVLEMPNHSHAIFNERHDESLPENFGPAALFIDDCKDCYLECYTESGYDCGAIIIGMCWCWKKASCRPCYSKSHYSDECKKELGYMPLPGEYCTVPAPDWSGCKAPCD